MLFFLYKTKTGSSEIEGGNRHVYKQYYKLKEKKASRTRMPISALIIC